MDKDWQQLLSEGNRHKSSGQYIKIKGVSFCDYPYQNVIKDDLEIELYSHDLIF